MISHDPLPPVVAHVKQIMDDGAYSIGFTDEGLIVLNVYAPRAPDAIKEHAEYIRDHRREIHGIIAAWEPSLKGVDAKTLDHLQWVRWRVEQGELHDGMDSVARIRTLAPDGDDLHTGGGIDVMGCDS